MAQQYIQYGTTSGVTFTLASLAYSASLTVGRQSNVIDNTVSGAGGPYPDYYASARFVCGTSPQPSSIELWIVPRTAATGNALDLWPPHFQAAADAAVTVDSLNQKYDGLGLGAVINVDAVSNREYSVKPFSVAARFDGICPDRFAFFVTHNTFAALNTSGNFVWVTPVTNNLY